MYEADFEANQLSHLSMAIFEVFKNDVFSLLFLNDDELVESNELV